MHRNWRKTDFVEKFAAQAGRRNLKNLTVGPVITWDNASIKEHIDKVLELDGAELLFGGVPLRNHSIPAVYGSYEPTAIKVPLKHFRGKMKRQLLTTELFGPFSLVVEYGNKDVDFLLETLENLPHHLTAAVVSNDVQFSDHVLAHTINGT